MNIVYILSLAHSGSTINDLILGAHPSIQSCGEIKHLKRYTSNKILLEGKENKCTCGISPLTNCNFWKKIELDLIKANTSIFNLDSENYENEKKLIKDSEILFKSIFTVTNCKIILDSSKSHERLEILNKNPKFQIKTIFLYRDPLGQINSILKIKGYNVKSLFVAIKDYLIKNIRYLKLIFGLKQKYIIVNYNEFADNYIKSTKRLCKFISVDYKEEYFKKWQSQKHHNISGNNFRFDKNKRRVAVDKKWVIELPLIYKIFIFLFASPLYFLMNLILFFSKHR